jgi:hypothetical protein
VSSRESVHALVQMAMALGDVTGVNPRRWCFPRPAPLRHTSSGSIVYDS